MFRSDVFRALVSLQHLVRCKQYWCVADNTRKFSSFFFLLDECAISFLASHDSNQVHCCRTVCLTGDEFLPGSSATVADKGRLNSTHSITLSASSLPIVRRTRLSTVSHRTFPGPTCLELATASGLLIVNVDKCLMECRN